MGSCVVCSALDRYVSQHVDQHNIIGQLSIDTSTNAQPTPLCRYVAQKDQHIGRASTNMSTNIWTDIISRDVKRHTVSV